MLGPSNKKDNLDKAATYFLPDVQDKTIDFSEIAAELGFDPKLPGQSFGAVARNDARWDARLVREEIGKGVFDTKVIIDQLIEQFGEIHASIKDIHVQNIPGSSQAKAIVARMMAEKAVSETLRSQAPLEGLNEKLQLMVTNQLLRDNSKG